MSIISFDLISHNKVTPISILTDPSPLSPDGHPKSNICFLFGWSLLDPWLSFPKVCKPNDEATCGLDPKIVWFITLNLVYGENIS